MFTTLTQSGGVEGTASAAPCRVPDVSACRHCMGRARPDIWHHPHQESRGRLWLQVRGTTLKLIPPGVPHPVVSDVLVGAGFRVVQRAATACCSFTHRYGTTPHQESRGRLWLPVRGTTSNLTPPGHSVALRVVACVLVGAGFRVFPRAATAWGGLTQTYGTTPTKNPEVDCGCRSGAQPSQ